eukprot:SAG11_NODE_3736_length_2257_cov_68.839203_1_plen_362_part_10
MEPEAEPEAEPVAEPQPAPRVIHELDPISMDILKLIKQQFDIKLAEKEGEIQRLTEVLTGPIRTIAGYDGGYWDECNEDVRQEFCDELEQAGIDDIDCVSLSTLRRYVPDIEGSVYYELREAYEYVTHGEEMKDICYLAARKIQSAARGRAVRRAMKMDDEDAAAAPEPAAEPEPAPAPAPATAPAPNPQARRLFGHLPGINLPTHCEEMGRAEPGAAQFSDDGLDRWIIQNYGYECTWTLLPLDWMTENFRLIATYPNFRIVYSDGDEQVGIAIVIKPDTESEESESESEEQEPEPELEQEPTAAPAPAPATGLVFQDLPIDMDGFRNFMEQQTEALQMQFELYTAVTDLGEEEIARQWTQ